MTEEELESCESCSLVVLIEVSQRFAMLNNVNWDFFNYINVEGSLFRELLYPSMYLPVVTMFKQHGMKPSSRAIKGR